MTKKDSKDVAAERVVLGNAGNYASSALTPSRTLGGLSGKLLFLTISFVMLAEVLIYVPSVANFRNNWLQERLTTAGVGAIVLSETNTIAPRIQKELLESTGALAISLSEGGVRRLIAMQTFPSEIVLVADMGQMTPWRAITQSFTTLLYRGDGLMRVFGASRMGDKRRVDIVLPISLLQHDMLAFSTRILGLSLFISLITAVLVYFSLRALFVRPLQRLSHSMTHFTEFPEEVSGIIEVSGRKDELGEAENHLNSMQKTLSRALQQKQRLADLGLAVSKINHDLRNLLASAQLFMERLEHVDDPTVARIAPKILNTLDRAVSYTQAVMAYGKATEQLPERRLVSLWRIGEDVADVLGLSEDTPVQFHNQVPAQLELQADPEQLFRVVLNLCRNSVQAFDGDIDDTLVRRICMDARQEDGQTLIRISDTGPGIPPMWRKTLFKAFQGPQKAGGTGLGLSIVAELVKAHGGVIMLEEGDVGTSFLIRLPQ